jgi:type IV pilus assembly protein PilC
MPEEYTYRAWSKVGGTEVTGRLVATSEYEARRSISSDEFLLLEVHRRRTPWLAKRMHLRRAVVRLPDAAWLIRQLATTQTVGLPIKEALDSIGRQQAGTPVGVVVQDLSRRLAEGEELGVAFGAHVAEFGPAATAVISSGAASGRMSESFARVAKMLEDQAWLRRRVRGALAYPVVVAILTAALTTAMLFLVVPTFRGLYVQLGGRLPFPTRMLLGVSSIVRSYFWVLAAVVLSAVVLFRRWRNRPDHGLIADRMKARIPILGKLVTKAAIARSSATLATLLDAGVTTLAAIDLSADSAGLVPVGASLREVGAAVKSGDSLSGALRLHGQWPDTMVQLTRLGEETGQMAELLTRYAAISFQEVTADVDRIVSLIEPLMVVAIGAAVGVAVVCLYLPLFDLINLVK